ncbi:MAG: DNA alkylation repair protein [Pseudomonadota bacterium]
MTTLDAARAALLALADADRAAQAAAYHKAKRRYLGIAVPQVTELAKGWRQGMAPDARAALACALWDTDIHEARVAAAKLLVQARIRPDQAVWAEIARWVPQFDAWAIADHAAEAGSRRLVADPARLEEVEGWTASPLIWARRAAFVFTLPWAKLTHPGAEDLARRERILGWAAEAATEREWFMQKAVAWWLRTLSKHDPARVQVFLDGPGGALKPFAKREASKYLA